MAYEYNLSACLYKWTEHRTPRQKEKESFWITLIISVYIHSKVQHVCVCVFLHPSDFKPLWLRFHWRREKKKCYAGCESAALREGRAVCGLYSGSIAPCSAGKHWNWWIGCVKKSEVGGRTGPQPLRPPLSLARVSDPTQEHPQRSTTMEGILP